MSTSAFAWGNALLIMNSKSFKDSIVKYLVKSRSKGQQSVRSARFCWKVSQYLCSAGWLLCCNWISLFGWLQVSKLFFKNAILIVLVLSHFKAISYSSVTNYFIEQNGCNSAYRHNCAKTLASKANRQRICEKYSVWALLCFHVCMQFFYVYLGTIELQNDDDDDDEEPISTREFLMTNIFYLMNQFLLFVHLLGPESPAYNRFTRNDRQLEFEEDYLVAADPQVLGLLAESYAQCTDYNCFFACSWPIGLWASEYKRANSSYNATWDSRRSWDSSISCSPLLCLLKTWTLCYRMLVGHCHSLNASFVLS